MPSIRKTPKMAVAKDVLRNPTQPAKVTKKTPTDSAEKASTQSIKVRSKVQSDRLDNWAYTHELPSAAARSKNGRVPGRILINWTSR